MRLRHKRQQWRRHGWVTPVWVRGDFRSVRIDAPDRVGVSSWRNGVFEAAVITGATGTLFIMLFIAKMYDVLGLSLVGLWGTFLGTVPAFPVMAATSWVGEKFEKRSKMSSLLLYAVTAALLGVGGYVALILLTVSESRSLSEMPELLVFGLFYVGLPASMGGAYLGWRRVSVPWWKKGRAKK